MPWGMNLTVLGDGPEQNTFPRWHVPQVGQAWSHYVPVSITCVLLPWQWSSVAAAQEEILRHAIFPPELLLPLTFTLRFLQYSQRRLVATPTILNCISSGQLDTRLLEGILPF